MSFRKKPNLLFILSAVLLMGVLAACGASTAATTPTPQPEPAGATAEVLTEKALANLEYQSEMTQSGTAQLVDGEYREQAAPGSATETIVGLSDYIAYGELNGQEVAAVVLITDPGGSGTFYDLAVVANQDGEPVHVASILLGDRVQINSLNIVDNQIVVDMITQGPDDPMCCPTQQVVNTYELQDDQLVEVSSEVVGTVETAEPQEAEVVTMYVGPELVDCTGVAPQKCMQVKTDPDAEYTNFYDQIEGFEYEPGYEYELRVMIEPVENPPADASSLKYTLVEEVSKTPVAAAQVVTMYVGPELVDCTGVAPQKCMQVKTDPDAEYTNFYDQIEGFEYEPGYEYELQVMIEPVENPPADASSLKYTLVEEVSKTPVAAAQEGEAASVSVEGALWVLQSYMNADGETVEVLPETRVTAEFADGTVGGSTGCNQYNGAYTLDGDSLTVELGPMTMMACPEPIMAQEQDYMAALGSSATYEISNEQLQISNADGEVVLTFNVDQPAALVGTNWRLLSYNNTKGIVSSLTTELITAVYGEDGQVSGFAGCNDYFGSYETDGDAIKIGPLGTTRKMCAEPEGVMDDEAGYLGALERSVRYEIEGDTMTFYDENDTRQVIYKVDTVTSAAAPEELQLVGPVWHWLQTLGGDDSVLNVDDPGQYAVNFQEDGTVAIKADCNNASGTYTTEGSSLSIMIGPMTMAACPPDSLSDTFIQQLGFVATYVIQDGNLYLNMMADAGDLKFAPAEATTAAAPEEGVATVAAAAQPAPSIRTFHTLLPSSDSPGRYIRVTLNEDGTLEVVTDYLNSEPPFVEVGTWEALDDGGVRMIITGTPEETYDEPISLTFEREGKHLKAVEYDVSLYGTEGLPLRQLSATQTPAATAERAFVTLDLAAGSPLDPFIVSVNGGGDVDASPLTGGCGGYVHQNPIVTLNWEGEAESAEIFFYSDHDPTLIVQTPSGEYLCNDDANPLLLDPAIYLDNPEPGRYNIWVGSFYKDQLLPGVLVLTTRPEINLGTFQLGGLIQRPPIPEELQTEEGRLAAKQLFNAIKQRQGDIVKLRTGEEPLTANVTSEGTLAAFEFDLEDVQCNGFIDDIPDYVFDWSGQTDTLVTYFEGDEDATLLVVGPEGKIFCNDDAVEGGNVNPLIVIKEPANGLYAIFVGRLHTEAPVTGDLTITDSADAGPKTLEPGQ